MRRLLIIGCGDVARRALPELLRKWRIMALVRQRDPALAAAGVRQLIGDLDHVPSLRRLAGLAHAVLYCAPPPGVGDTDPRMPRLLATLRRSGCPPPRIVYVSTSGVYGDCGGARVAETRPPHPESARARRRVDAEQSLRRYVRMSAAPVVLLRAPGIYASERLPLERLRVRAPLLNADEDSYTNHIHADDLAHACVIALSRGTGGRAFNICDDSALAMGEWFDLLADRSGLPRAPRVTRDEARARLSPLQWSFMRESRRLDNSRAQRELRWRPRFATVNQWLALHNPLPLRHP